MVILLAPSRDYYLSLLHWIFANNLLCCVSHYRSKYIVLRSLGSALFTWRLSTWQPSPGQWQEDGSLCIWISISSLQWPTVRLWPQIPPLVLMLTVGSSRSINFVFSSKFIVICGNWSAALNNQMIPINWFLSELRLAGLSGSHREKSIR